MSRACMKQLVYNLPRDSLTRSQFLSLTSSKSTSLLSLSLSGPWRPGARRGDEARAVQRLTGEDIVDGFHHRKPHYWYYSSAEGCGGSLTSPGGDLLPSLPMERPPNGSPEPMGWPRLPPEIPPASHRYLLLVLSIQRSIYISFALIFIHDPC